ncbi:hypothetical protein R3P38DRAFT_3165558 [Favolaschia claudopus]|uniref:Uncharacterized protein n=1 Tax=Favolaschia claudopus TaxID=2862362 RepID=A0AAW0EIY5_9AGAR
MKGGTFVGLTHYPQQTPSKLNDPQSPNAAKCLHTLCPSPPSPFIIMATMHASRPAVSSPLANPINTHSSSGPAAARMVPQRAYSFPRSSALRPLPLSVAVPAASKKPVKMIQPPASQRGSFVLNLTQAELGRQ